MATPKDLMSDELLKMFNAKTDESFKDSLLGSFDVKVDAGPRTPDQLADIEVHRSLHQHQLAQAGIDIQASSMSIEDMHSMASKARRIKKENSTSTRALEHKLANLQAQNSHLQAEIMEQQRIKDVYGDFCKSFGVDMHLVNPLGEKALDFIIAAYENKEQLYNIRPIKVLSSETFLMVLPFIASEEMTTKLDITISEVFREPVMKNYTELCNAAGLTTHYLDCLYQEYLKSFMRV